MRAMEDWSGDLFPTDDVIYKTSIYVLFAFNQSVKQTIKQSINGSINQSMQHIATGIRKSTELDAVNWIMKNSSLSTTCNIRIVDVARPARMSIGPLGKLMITTV